MRNKLVLGNILDAFGTDLFGTDIERSINGKESIERLSYLSNKRIFDKNFTAEEGKELKNLEQIFIQNNHLPLTQLKSVLDTEITNWKGKNEQVDDILVIGIRV